MVKTSLSSDIHTFSLYRKKHFSYHMYIFYLKNQYSEKSWWAFKCSRDAITCSSINAAVSTIRLRACLSSDRAAWSFCSSSSLNVRSPCWEILYISNCCDRSFKHHDITRIILGWPPKPCKDLVRKFKWSPRGINWQNTCCLYIFNKMGFFFKSFTYLQ